MQPRAQRVTLAAVACTLLAAGTLHDPAAQQTSVTEESPAPAQARPPLRLVYLANEGFLVEVGEQKALFDAFVATPYRGYPALTKELAAKLRSAEEPFDGVDLTLTSHAHTDHFQPSIANAFLSASPDTPFVAPPQAQTALKNDATDPDALDGRMFGEYPEAGKHLSQTFGEGEAALHVRHLRIPHGGRPDVQNFGTVLTIGGHRVLHLGDADIDPKLFAPYEEELKNLDVALVPYWFYATKPGREIVERYLPAKMHVAMHFAKRDQAGVVRSFLENHEGVRAFAKPLEEIIQRPQ